MMKKTMLLIFFAFMTAFNAFSQDNDFFIKLAEKKLATFNDGITLMKLLYNEKDDNFVFIDNVLWAAGKKLFKVTIPIKADTINPLLTRAEFAYWICKVFNTEGGLVNTPYLNKYYAFKKCVDVGIITEGRGASDSFTGAELLDTFSFLDYYVRANDIKPKKGILEKTDDTYKNLPEWRLKLHRELEEQREMEKQQQLKKKELQKQKSMENMKKIRDKEKYIEKNSEKKIEN
jgi:hypothetical protein